MFMFGQYDLLELKDGQEQLITMSPIPDLLRLRAQSLVEHVHNVGELVMVGPDGSREILYSPVHTSAT